jgi:DNA mismatch endonuclease, patch repair protein
MDNLTKAERSERMRLIRSKDSRFELRVRSAVHLLGYRFRKHVPTLPGKPDMVFASRRSIIFVNGCYWHGHDCRLARMPKSNSVYWSAKIRSNKTRDARHRTALKQAGWKVLTVWECERTDFTAVLRRIRHFLGVPRRKTGVHRNVRHAGRVTRTRRRGS